MSSSPGAGAVSVHTVSVPLASITGARIHVLLTHPFFWPHVMRGAEREVHGVGSGLAARGHRVDLLTGQPSGIARRADIDGIHVRYLRTPLPGALARRGVRREAAFVLPAAAAALSRSDAVLSFYYADAVGATVLRRKRPVVLKLTGLVPRDRVAHDRVERALLSRALDEAAQVWVNSAFVVDAMRDWDRPMDIVPAGVDVELFRDTGGRSAEPLVVCAAAPDDPRKRLVDLIDAWPAVVDAVPEARLLLVQTYDDATRGSLLDRLPTEMRPTVAFEGPYSGVDLAAVYSRAWTTVAPAVYEALGLATLESLACGTPVVGARSGATVELLDDAGVGRLYEPLSPQDCAAAIVTQLGSTDSAPGREHRRAVALRYAWPQIVDEVECRLRGLTGG